MELRTRAEADYDHPRERVFDVLVHCETFPKILTRMGPIAGVTEASMIDGADLERGAVRRITMDDGAVLHEEIIAFQRPVEHAYTWGEGLKPPFSWLVRQGTGRWIFWETRQGTHVDWTYTFDLTTPLALPVAKPIIALFTRWMRRALAQASVQLGSR